MPLIAEANLQVAITRLGRSVLSTRSDLAAPLSGQTGHDQWKRIIDKLKDWQKDSSGFDDEDYEPPRCDVIAEAIELAIEFRNAKWLPPHSVVPDAGGGIVFERRNGFDSQKIHLWGDGTVEYIETRNHKVVDRRNLR